MEYRKSFPGNFYVNIIVLFILESVSYCVAGILIDVKKLGRKGTLWIQYAIVVVIFILLAFLQLDTYGELALNYIARFCCAGIEVIYYTYSIELYPTPVRSLAFGINATFGNAGSIGAPYLLEFLISWQNNKDKIEEKIEDDLKNENKNDNIIINNNSNSDEEKKEENKEEKKEEDNKEKEKENKNDENKDVNNEEKMDDVKGPEEN